MLFRSKLKPYRDCCKRRSQESICLESSKTHKFCKENSICTIDGIEYKIYRSQNENHAQYLCAKSNSLCPHNFLVGLGTEVKDEVIENNNTKIKNFCQYLNHCSKSAPYDSDYIFDFDGYGARYLSSACSDLRGDSQFRYDFEVSIAPGQIRNFTAPIAQCFQEDRKSTRLNSSHSQQSRMPSSA